MKESNVGRIAFGVSIGTTLVFTLISILTPAWRTFHTKPGEVYQGPAVPSSVGLFRYQCVGESQNLEGKSKNLKEKKPDVDFCNYIFDHRAPWDTAVVYTLIFTLVIELITILYLFLPREFCCERYEWMAAPYSCFALWIFIMLLYGVINYAERYDEIQDLLHEFSLIFGHGKFNNSSLVTVHLGYSYYLSCVALFQAFISLLAGIFNVTLAWCFLW